MYSLRFTKYIINTSMNMSVMYSTSIRNIEKDKQKAYPVHSSSEQYNWISAKSVASFTKNTKHKASYGKTARNCITLRQTVNKAWLPAAVLGNQPVLTHKKMVSSWGGTGPDPSEQRKSNLTVNPYTKKKTIFLK